jgi:flagellar basal body L-ring protein FlgH
MKRLFILPLFIVTLWITPEISAQSGSLSGTTALVKPNGKSMKMSETSLTWQAAPRQKVYKVDDIIYVHYKSNFDYANTANNQRKKSIKTSSKLTAWFKWPDLFKMPVSSDADLPGVGGELDHKTQNQGTLKRKETLDFNIACTVSSIQDNGNLFIEGTFSSNIGEEGKVMYICGYIRPESISSKNTVESSEMAGITCNEVPQGNIYDTTRRTWGARFIEQWKPF